MAPSHRKLLQSPVFFCFLLRLDQSILSTTKKEGCRYCKSTLHSSNWWRKGFGLPEECPNEVYERHSLICSKCKRRNTPNSLRWRYYGHYASCVHLVISALAVKEKTDEVNKLMKETGISKKLLGRWRKWWRETFCVSRFWQYCSSFFGSFIAPSKIPSIILEYFEKISEAFDGLTGSCDFLSRYRTDRLWDKHPTACADLISDRRYSINISCISHKTIFPSNFGDTFYHSNELCLS